MSKPIHDRLLIIDFGSQVTQLIARRLRKLNVYCEIHPYQNVTSGFLADFAPKAVILSGGPASVIADDSPRPPLDVFNLGVPVLGICYGQQVMMHILGGTVMGSRPETSVTDSYGRCHELDNLYVAGPGLFPTSGAVNPTFSIHALTLRAAENLLKSV